MAVALHGGSSNVAINHGDSTTASVAYPTTRSVGDVVVLIIAAASGCDFSTPPTGWTWVYTQVDAGGSNINQNWFLRFLDGTETGSVSTTATNYGGSWIAHMAPYSGVDTSSTVANAIRNLLGGTGGTTTAVQAPSLTSSVGTLANPQSGDMLITAHAHTHYGASTATSFTPPSGMTEISDTSETGDGAQHALEVNNLLLTAAGATGVKSATCSVSPSQRCGVAFLLKPGASTTPISSSDTGTGTDAGEATSAALTDIETASAADVGALIGTNDTETATGLDDQTLAGQVSDTDPTIGTDTETVAVVLDETDSALADTGEALAVQVDDADPATTIDEATVSVATGDDDSATGDDDGTILAVTSISDTDAGTGVENQAIIATPLDDDFATAAEAEGLVIHIAASDTATTFDEELLAIGVTDTDTGFGIDLEVELAQLVFDADVGSVAEAEHVIVEVLTARGLLPFGGSLAVRAHISRLAVRVYASIVAARDHTSELDTDTHDTRIEVHP